MSDSFWSIAHVYMVMYSTEITVGAALLIGFALGAWLFYADGKDKGRGEGFESGFNLGFDTGHREGVWQSRAIVEATLRQLERDLEDRPVLSDDRPTV